MSTRERTPTAKWAAYQADIAERIRRRLEQQQRRMDAAQMEGLIQQFSRHQPLKDDDIDAALDQAFAKLTVGGSRSRNKSRSKRRGNKRRSTRRNL